MSLSNPIFYIEMNTETMADTQPLLATDEAGLTSTKTLAVAGTPLQCLVVSQDKWRLERLAEAARSGGWYAIVCDDAESATTRTTRTVVRMAIVDLEQTDDLAAEPLGRLASQLVGQKELLLIVCGPESDAQVELWARQLGVWLYLAGAELGPEFASICSEAFQVVQRLTIRSAGALTNRSNHEITHR